MTGPAQPGRRASPVPRAVWSALRDFQGRGQGHDAAALTYYAVFAVIPAVVALVATVGLFGQNPETTNAILDLIGRIGPSSATETFRGTVEAIIEDKGGAGALLGVGLIGAGWSATGWLDAFFRVANTVHETTEHRPFVRRKALQVGLTVGLGLALAILVTLVVVTGPVAREAADALGAGDGVLRVWSIGKWPVAAVLAAGLVCVLLRVAPDLPARPWRPIVAGAALSVAIWAVASTGFGIYVASFGSYNATYGALGAVIVFLLWMWITNAALIIGTSVETHLGGRRRAGASNVTPAPDPDGDPTGRPLRDAEGT